MKNWLVPPALVALFALSLFAQSPSPSPPADDAEVVKISTTLIQVDVTVKDRKGKVVSDLKREEIEIYENGEKQKLSNFSFVSSIREQSETASSKPSAALPPSPVRPEQVRRTIALVVDDLTLSFESTYQVRRALKKFVDEQMQEGDLVAIIRTGAGIGALQQFTTDRRQLHAAIEKVRWNPAGAGNIGAFAPLQGRVDTGEEERPASPGERTPEGIEREFNDFRESVFATGTLGAINYIVRGMQDLPGRKSVMLLSDGFSLFTTDASGFRDSGRVLQSLRRLVDQANRASVVIHTMDARGLVYTGITAADDTGGRSIEQLEREMSDRRNKLFDTQDGLRYLARQTGGTSIVNNNDLSGGIRKILDDQSYYLVGYEPDDDTFDPRTTRFHKLEVKVTRPGVNVRYRSGFFGVADERMQATRSTGGQRLMTALTSPFAVNEIPLRLNALFGADAKHDPYIKSLLHISAQDLKFTDEPDGSKKAVFDLLAIGFGDNGIPVERSSKTFTATLKKEGFEDLIKGGLVYDFTFPVKKPGAYQLRLAVRDHATEKVGSANQFIEVPNLKKERLALSGVVLENISLADWQKREKTPGLRTESDPHIDTSLRRFKRGTVLNYGFAIYNAKLDMARQPNLTSQTRIYRDGKVIYEGRLQPVSPAAATDPKSINFMSALSLGSEMVPGDYVLEIVITDNLAKEKRKTATQYVQFELAN